MWCYVLCFLVLVLVCFCFGTRFMCLFWLGRFSGLVVCGLGLEFVVGGSRFGVGCVVYCGFYFVCSACCVFVLVVCVVLDVVFFVGFVVLCVGSCWFGVVSVFGVEPACCVLFFVCLFMCCFVGVSVLY